MLPDERAQTRDHRLEVRAGLRDRLHGEQKVPARGLAELHEAPDARAVLAVVPTMELRARVDWT